MLTHFKNALLSLMTYRTWLALAGRKRPGSELKSYEESTCNMTPVGSPSALKVALCLLAQPTALVLSSVTCEGLTHMPTQPCPVAGDRSAAMHLQVCRVLSGGGAGRKPASELELACHICAQCPWVTGVHDATSAANMLWDHSNNHMSSGSGAASFFTIRHERNNFRCQKRMADIGRHFSSHGTELALKQELWFFFQSLSFFMFTINPWFSTDHLLACSVLVEKNRFLFLKIILFKNVLE